MARLAVSITLDKLGDLAQAVKKLSESQVLVGVPEDKTARKDGARITNAQLAYIHSNGAPEANIPARPFLDPGIQRVKSDIEDKMRQAAEAGLSGEAAKVEQRLGQVGQVAVNSAQAIIRAGIAPPLKQSTVARRGVRSAGSKYRRKATSAAQTTPLVDTGQLLRAITWVIRKVRR